MTSVRRINWAVLGATVGSAVLFTPAAAQPHPVGCARCPLVLGLAIGTALGIYFCARRDRYTELGPDAEETRFLR